MNNLLSDCGLVYARIRGAEKDLPVYRWVSIAIEAISNCCSKNLRYYRDYDQKKISVLYIACSVSQRIDAQKLSTGAHLRFELTSIIIALANVNNSEKTLKNPQN